MDDKKIKGLDDKTLDFEKMNATLANPKFANWYYNQMINKTDMNVSIEDFVQIIQEYSENKFE